MKNHHCCSSHEKEPDKAARNGCSCSHAPKEDMCSCGHVHDKDDCHCSHSPSEHSCRCSHTHNEDSCGNHPEKHHAHSDCGCGCGHDHGEDEQKRLPLLIACVGVFGILLVLERLVPIHRAILLLLYLIPYLGAGWPILVRSAKNLLHGRIFDENLLMSVASIGAFSIGQYEEGTAVTLFFCIGEWLESVAVGRTRRSVQSLMEIRPDTARIVCDDHTTRQVDAALVCVGDIIEVRAGERIPLDGIVTNGSAGLNTSALTGESLPRTVGVGDPVFAGCVCTDSDLRIAVTRPAAESTVQRILDTAQHAAEKKTRTEAFITRFSRVYTPIVVIGALMLAVIPTLIVGSPLTWIHRALTFLVVSCPCALVISVPLSFFCGIGGASSKGILIKSSQAIEALAHTEIVASDKTGTLTHGKFRVTGIHPLNDMTEDALLALAAQAEAHSSHPAALGILAAYRESGAEQSYTEVTHTTVAGRGVKATIEGDTVLVGNTAMMQEFGIAPTCVEAGSTACTVHVAKNGEYLGCIVLADTLKEDAVPALQKMRALGVHEIHILTGDTEEAAASVSQMLGVNGYHAALMPDEKMQCAQALKERCSPAGTLLFIGDGINDAPLLAAADVGCAMGALGTDAAMDAADVVIMNDSPVQAASAIQIAKKTVRIAKQNIFFALTVKCLILLLGALGITGMWSAVFGDVGVSILCILNAARCADNRIKKQNKGGAVYEH